MQRHSKNLSRPLAAMILYTIMHTNAVAAESASSPPKAPADRNAVVCVQGGNCLQTRSGVVKSEGDRRARRSPLWFLEEIFFN